MRLRDGERLVKRTLRCCVRQFQEGSASQYQQSESQSDSVSNGTCQSASKKRSVGQSLEEGKYSQRKNMSVKLRERKTESQSGMGSANQTKERKENSLSETGNVSRIRERER
jgi:hypothetical protein